MQTTNEIFRREFQLDRASADKTARTVELSFSSEASIARSFGNEVLSHDPTAINLSRLNSGTGSVLWNHDPGEFIGKVERAWVSGKKARAVIRFGNSERAKAAWLDVSDGILTGASVGYSIEKMERSDSDPETYVATRWTPIEVSLVSCPADVTCGIGRSATERNRMTVNEPNGHAQEIEAISKILEARGVRGISQLASRAILSNMDVEQFRAEAFKLLPNVQPVRQAEPLDVKPKDWARYSITRALRMQLPEQRRDGLEEELSQELSLKTGRRAAGCWVPNEALTYQAQRNFVAATGTLGGFLVSTENMGSQFVELLRNRAKVVQLGAKVIDLGGPVTIPRQNAAGSANWVGETVAATLSTGNFTQITLTPNGLSAFQQYGKQLLYESSPGIDELIRNDIMQILALEIDRVVLHGTGSGQPTGITASTGVSTLALGADGAAFAVSNAYTSMVSLESLLATSNADQGNLAYLTNAKMRGRLKRIDENLTTTSARWVWQGGASDGRVNGYRAEVSNQISAIQTQGTATTICSSVFFGNWGDILIAQFGGGVDLTIDPYSLAQNAVVRVIARQWVDIGIRHPASFAVLLGCLDA